MDKYIKITNLKAIGFFQALGVIIYCSGIGSLFWFLGKYFSDGPQVFSSIIMLCLLVFSAGITGSLVFGYPAYLALNQRIKDAIMVLAYTFLSLAVIIAFLLILILR